MLIKNYYRLRLTEKERKSLYSCSVWETRQMNYGRETLLSFLETENTYDHHNSLQIWKEVMAQRLSTEIPSLPLLRCVTLNWLLGDHWYHICKMRISVLISLQIVSFQKSIHWYYPWNDMEKVKIASLGETWNQIVEHSQVKT